MPYVVAVSASPEHTFRKRSRDFIRLLAGLGIEGDAHCGETVKHRSRVAQNPDQPNLRQVHLIQAELFGDLESRGFSVEPGDLGENITTQGIDLLSLPVGAVLAIGADAVVEITGLRNPCAQIDSFQKGLLAAVLDTGDTGELIRKAGVMAVVRAGGEVGPGDEIAATLPPPPHRALERV